MIVTKQHNIYGEIIFEESIWTGKRTITLNGEKLMKIDKEHFRSQSGFIIALKGNIITGLKMYLNLNEGIVITPTCKWYEYVLSIIPLILILVWGNTVALYNIVPVLGGLLGNSIIEAAIYGGIGGAIGCVGGFFNLFIIKKINNVFVKIAISLGIIVACFSLAFLVAELIIM